MKIKAKKPKQYICIFTMPVSTAREGSFFTFMAMDAYSEYVITHEIMPSNSLREYRDFIKLLADRENIKDSILILDIEKLEDNDKQDLLNSAQTLKGIVADAPTCNALTRELRKTFASKFR